VIWVISTLSLLVAVAAVIVVVVAVPHLRSGSQVLTPQGERLVREARSRLTNSGSQE
jgi:hypothetical protein